MLQMIYKQKKQYKNNFVCKYLLFTYPGRAKTLLADDIVKKTVSFNGKKCFPLSLHKW